VSFSGILRAKKVTKKGRKIGGQWLSRGEGSKRRTFEEETVGALSQEGRRIRDFACYEGGSVSV